LIRTGPANALCPDSLSGRLQFVNTLLSSKDPVPGSPGVDDAEKASFPARAENRITPHASTRGPRQSAVQQQGSRCLPALT
jgi:hypothetical protein